MSKFIGWTTLANLIKRRALRKGYDFDEAIKALGLHTHKKAKMVDRDIYIQLKSDDGKYGRYTYLSIIDAEGKDVDLTLGELIVSRWFLVKE